MLILNLASSDLFIKYLWDDPVNSVLAVQHFVALLGIALPEHDVDLLEGADTSFFIPLSVFRQHVRIRQPTLNSPEMIAFVYDQVKAAVLLALAESK